MGNTPGSHYLQNTFSNVLDEIDQAFDVGENVYFTAIDYGLTKLSDAVGKGTRVGKNGGFMLVPGKMWLSLVAHELGHAFGLSHDFRSNSYIMSYGGPDLRQARLSACHAEFLAVHPSFNPDVPIEEAPPPTIELISSPAYPAGSVSLSIQLELSDPDGLHQVFLYEGRPKYGGSPSVWECRGLTGKKDVVVEFDYYGYSAYSIQHPIKVLAVDTDGNVSTAFFELKVGHGVPSTLVKISGDNRQGPTNAPLAHPFAVEVRDQDGNPLQGVQIAFTVIAGGGTLSGRFTVENATTDASGRTQSILTLGPDPGTNIVNVSAPGYWRCKPVFFAAIGIGTPTLTTTDDDYRTWHVPDDAILRIGKGKMGTGDKAVAFSPDGQRLAVSSGIGIYLYDVATLRELALLPTPGVVYSVSFSPDGTTLASGSSGGEVHLWDVATRAHTATLSGHRYWVTSVSFSTDGAILASGSSIGEVRLWDVATRAHIADYYIERETRLFMPTSVSISPDGTLASGSEDGTVKLWDVATRAHTATLSGHRERVTSVSFSPDGTLASASEDGAVKLWDIATGRNIATLLGHTVTVTSISFSHNGTTLAAGSQFEVKVWDVATGGDAATLSGHRHWVTSMSFSPDGTLASGSEDGTVKLWDVGTRTAASLAGHANLGESVSFSSDGATLASGSSDGTVKLWDVETGRNIDRFGSNLVGNRNRVVFARRHNPRCGVIEPTSIRAMGHGDGYEYPFSWSRRYGADIFFFVFARWHNPRFISCWRGHAMGRGDGHTDRHASGCFRPFRGVFTRWHNPCFRDEGRSQAVGRGDKSSFRHL